MKKVINILFLFVLIFSTSPKVFGLAEFQQTILTTAPAAVSVTAINPAQTQGSINPQTGNSSSPSAGFQLQTNGTDANYNYVINASVLTTGGVSVNGYAQNGASGYIMLGNNSPLNYPTALAVTNITGGSPVAAQNANVIAYPVSNTLNNLSSATLSTNVLYGGLYYSVKTGSSQNGTLTQTVGAAPLAGTYSFANDLSGTYQAIVTFTANRNP